jgi:DNA invertase Pin-like site-specific DNA recombinase
VFTDQDVSANRLDRPGLMQAMHLVRISGCDVLVTSDVSRLTRDASGFASIVSDADVSGVVVVTADGAVDTSGAPGQCAVRLLATFAG